MLKFKDGVRWDGVSPEIIVAILAIEEIITGFSYDHICWITSIRDGAHKAESRHYIGEAFDCRSKNIMAGVSKGDVLVELKKALPGYFVQIEYEGQDNEHFHIQRNEGAK